MNALNFRDIGDSVSSVFVFIGFDLSLANKKTKEGLKMLHFETTELSELANKLQCITNLLEHLS